MTEPRHTPGETEISYPRADGSIRTLRSQTLDGDPDYHYVQPLDGEDATILAGFDFPIARKALAAQKTDEPLDGSDDAQEG